MSETAKPSMDAFFTRQMANDGIELPLYLPDGKPTEHRIRIRSIDSDAFQRADSEARKHLLEISLETDKEKAATMLEEHRLRVRASLVISWTFEQECTEANIMKFLQEAPQIAKEIDRLSGRRSLFFKKGSASSTPSQEVSSS